MSQHGCPERLSNRSKGFQEDGSSQPTMEVLVETLTGTAFEMTVSPSDTILAIKSKICRVEGIPVSQQHLVYKLRELDDSSSLRALGIVHGARLRLVLGLRGGPVATRRLPRAEPWRDLPRLLGPNREDDEEWGSASGSGASGSGAGGAGGCKVTVLVFRDGERVNMLRVRENRDGTYSPLDQQKYSSSLTHLAEDDVCDDDIASGAEVGGEAAAVALHQNAVTQNKMVALRRRMQSLSVRRRAPPGERPEIQKTRSEESLAVHGLIDETNAALFIDRIYPTYSEIDENFIPRYERSYSKYEYHKAFADAYELPPPRRRAEAKQAVLEAVSENNINRLSVSESYGAGGGLVVAGAGAGAEAARGDERAPASRRTRQLGMLSPQEYARIACGEAAWRARGFGSSSQLAPAPAPLAPPSPAHAHSASSLHAPPARPPPPRAPPLAVLSSSTSDLEKLRRNRILPALSRHRNREHLHLSDEGLNLSHRPHLEVGSERRQRRIEKIAEMENSRLYTFGDFEYVEKETVEPQKEEIEKKEVKEKKLRIRCGFCKKKLSIATVHKCRCGAEFCAPHRYAEVHGCAYDYKANAHQYLQRANPLVSAPKLPKI